MIIHPSTPRIARDPLLFLGVILFSEVVFLILFVLSVLYAVYAAITVISIIAAAVSFSIFEEDLPRLLSALVVYVPLAAPFFLTYGRYASQLDMMNGMGFAMVSIVTVLSAAMLVDSFLFGSPLVRLFQLAKRFLRARTMRYVLSLLSIATYAIGVTVLSAHTQPYGLLIVSGIVICNTAVTMVGNVHDRRREISTLATVGLNPDHFVGLFLAEALMLGFLGGGIGYVGGLYAIVSASLPISMYELSTGWMVTVILFSTATAITATILPALKASMIATPSLLKRWWREAPPFEGWPPTWTFKMPVKLTEDSVEGFIDFFVERLNNLSETLQNAAIPERINDLELSESKPSESETTWRLRFKHFFNEMSTPMIVTENELRVSEDSESDELNVEFNMSVVRFYGVPNLYKYLWRMGSTYRKLALGWTLNIQ